MDGLGAAPKAGIHLVMAIGGHAAGSVQRRPCSTSAVPGVCVEGVEHDGVDDERVFRRARTRQRLKDESE